MKLKMVEGGAGYGPLGTIEGWMPGQVLEINDRDPRQKAWADGWLTMGAVDVTDEPDAVPTPAESVTRARRGSK